MTDEGLNALISLNREPLLGPLVKGGWLFCLWQKRLGDSFLGFDLDKKANFCYVPPISLTAQSGKDKKKKELFFYFHPISFVTKRDGVDGREKSRGNPRAPDRLSRLLPQTGFPNKDNRGFGKKSKRRKLFCRETVTSERSFRPSVVFRKPRRHKRVI